jgi:hypothetical protein
MEDLATRVDASRSTAARFYMVDLHVHSPASHDWGNSGSMSDPRDQRLDRVAPGGNLRGESTEAYREAITASGRELAAVTDHNVSSFGEALTSNGSPGSACILPGIELSVCFSDAPLIRDLRLHVLAIFPEGTHHEAFARILPSGAPPEALRDVTCTFTYSSVGDLVARIQAEGGLAIAAHVESANGLRALYKNTAELMLEPVGGSPEAREVLRALGDQVKSELCKFDAIQVSPTTDTVHYRGPNGNLMVPLIVASDCHEGKRIALEQSDKCSYIKMARPSFAALQDALKFPDARIRLKNGLPESKPPRLLGLRIAGHAVSEKAFFNDTTLGFSDNLTCLIGPRGSGKSAAIDALRYLMGYNRTLDQIRKVSGQVIDRQQNTLEKSRIEALYQAADGRIYRLAATYDPHEDYVTEVYDLDGNKLNIEDVEASGEFPLNLFGWGELELLAENPVNRPGFSGDSVV